MRRVLLHYHIFKNAGSTIEETFIRCFGDALLRTETSDSSGLVSNHHLLHLLRAQPNIRAVSSHQIRYPVPTAPGFLFLDLCIVRDPVDRVRSIYDFYRSRPNPGDPLSDLARGSLGEFVAGMVRHQQLHIKNVQVNLIACLGDSDEPEEHHLHLAIERLRNSAFLGVVDTLHTALVAGQFALQPVFPELDCAQPAENVTGGMHGNLARRLAEFEAACDPADFAELLRINALDLRLVEFARAEVARRFAKVPDAPAKLAEFERRIPAPLNARVSAWMKRLPPPAPPAPTAPARPAPTTAATKLRRIARLPADALTLLLHQRRFRANLFDARYYREKYRPASAPLLDFLLRGAFNGNKPNPLFDPAFYLRANPDVAASGANPLVHYLRSRATNRRPGPLFDPAFYLDCNPDVRQSAMPPLDHFLLHGAAEMRKPNPFFDPRYYARICAGAGIPASSLPIHFAESGASAANPHPLFDCALYAEANPEVIERDENPLAHYLANAQIVPESASAATLTRFTVDDVPVTIEFDAPSRPPRANPSLVVISTEPDGAVRIDAAPWQRPFFEAIPAAQFYAQR